MPGTLICGVNDRDDGRRALEMAVELSERLDLRLVLAHVRDGIGPISNGGGAESVSMKADRQGAALLLARLAAEYGVADSAERRSGTGDGAALIAQIAAEEAADLIVVGSRERGRLRRRLESRLARQLKTETPVPVLIAPPRTRVPKRRPVTAAGANDALMARRRSLGRNQEAVEPSRLPLPTLRSRSQAGDRGPASELGATITEDTNTSQIEA